jgi:hypothetical protein
MVRFVFLLVVAVILAAGTIAGAMWVNAQYGILPATTTAEKLEILKLLPATLAVVASIFTAAVSILSVRLQRDSARAIEAWKSELQNSFELFKRRLDFAGGDAGKAQEAIDRVKLAASSYHAELKRLETGHFSPSKINEIEKSAEILGLTIPRDTPYLESWFRFCQQGYCMSDIAKRKNSMPERQALWKDEGRLLSEQFEKLMEQLKVEELEIRTRALASDESN